MEFQMPEEAAWILEQLNSHGFEAYAVGGCVRDTLLGRSPEDWDITTSAKPEQVKEIFKRTIDTGVEHGTVTVMLQSQGYEVTTYRLDGEYEDGRHPKSVEFTSSLREDLRRRDFTINAMAYNPGTGIVDEFHGIEDLSAGIIRCVGNPHDRFTEDALRILRAIRFSAQLGFRIEDKTGMAISDIAPNIAKVSKERIQMELTKLLLSGNPEHVKLVFDKGISPYISDGFQKIPYNEIHISPKLEARKHMRWAAFLHVISPEAAYGIMKASKMDNDTISKTVTLVRWHSERIMPEKYAIRKVMSRMEPDLYGDLLCLKHFVVPCVQTQEELMQVEHLSREIQEAGDCISLKQLAVNGGDLIQAGMKPGKAVGETLARLLEMVLEEPSRNSREFLLSQMDF